MKVRGLLAAAVVVILILGSTSIYAQDQMNLGDGLTNSHVTGNANPVVPFLIPSLYFNGGYYYMANGSASATGHMQSAGTYVLYSASSSPFYLTHNADDSFTVTQTSPIYLSYLSPQGTLTGQLWLGSMAKTDDQLWSTATGILVSPGGTFAPYFPHGANVTLSFGLTFPLQLLWQVHGFSAAEVQIGLLTPSNGCMPLTQGYWKNHTGEWKNGSGLTLGTNFYTNSQLEALLQTPVRGDASIDLAHQLIAALLNMANGASGISVQATLADANTLLGSGTLPEGIRTSSPLGQQMVGDAATLDDYNNGRLTDGCLR